MLPAWTPRFFLFLFLVAGGRAEVKRVVIIKLDGVPQALLERELLRTDPNTNRVRFLGWTGCSDSKAHA